MKFCAAIERVHDRPMLPGNLDERRQRVRSLLHERRQAYAAIPHQVETTGLSPEQIVTPSARRARRRGRSARHDAHPGAGPDDAYHICIGDGLLQQAGQLLRNRDLHPGRAAIVSNPIIAAPLCRNVCRKFAQRRL